VNKAPPPRNLDALCGEAWRRLYEGVDDRHSPFHQPTVATIGADGAPQVRTVILRACDPAARHLQFHTDLRSGKAAEIARDPRVSLHVYDAAAQIQLRIAGTAVILLGHVAGIDAWKAVRLGSQATYAVEPGPGTEIAEGGAYAMPGDEAAILAGRVNFAAVDVTVETMEWMSLHAEGHRRAAFRWEDGRWRGRWLVP
jgi:pyridoxamine 5'-phosphate oxidase